jgi:bifunctional non-homologous end joining protein LigD
MSQPITTNLFSNHNGANKVYHAYLLAKDGGWVVNFAHAAVGQALKTGTKTEKPVEYAVALKKFNQLVNSKKNGDSHYVEGQPGAAYQTDVDSKALFGFFTQQPSPINLPTLRSLINDSDWSFSIKANGENRLFAIDAEGNGRGGNKKGQLTPIPMEWVEQARAFGPFVANGEHVGNQFYAFDLLEVDGVDIRSQPHEVRYKKLLAMTEGMANVVPFFKVITCAFTASEKTDLLEAAMEKQLEGIVAKRKQASYVAGKGHDTLKCVFREVATCIVMEHNAQRSVQVGLLKDDGVLVFVSNVTVPGNSPIPAVGDLVDVQYMYYNGKSFIIPVFDPNGVGVRKDVARSDCTFAQITRFKPADQESTHAAAEAMAV